MNPHTKTPFQPPHTPNPPSQSLESNTKKHPNWHIHRRLYYWVLHWAETPYGACALFILSFIASSFFPVPPDVLLVPLTLGNRIKWASFAFNCSIASVLGAIFGYGIGHWLWWTSTGEFSGIAHFFFNHIPGFTPEIFQKLKLQYDQYSFWIVFTAGFTPIPFKVITITSGAFNINFPIFVLAGVVSRSARFFLVAGMFWLFGPKIKPFIDKYFNWLCMAFTILLILGFIALKYL